ncbi:hypothetical protein SARC_06963 [Sphaeroforma arctica JP610]|uniref:Uncharacterized protein n=1 Tax=Sphaeroforma arctica JP610 TaxID=667725 RepID=A0A0L0FV34_9EUKA|nr:hypothetical protein SARC_06963 [Sphaeroforma arctica JP610]KNC80687.1 hypothetical protein SARC_06963 [Sphaeroforma arctica JP610]|eukprot:XP_014154589.1 hypothetical protein SARC_06963 [Sphaeroforma arctica JP610]
MASGTRSKKLNHFVIEKSNVLLLGMGFVSEQICNEQTGTTNPYVRDTRRARAIEDIGYHVHTINMQLEQKDSAGFPDHPRHIQLTWSRGARAVKQNLAQFPEGEKFKYILLDYFRFPSDYMRRAYTTNFFKSFILEGLRDHDFLTEDFQVIAPNSEAIVVALNESMSHYYIERIDDSDNPLWVGTENLYVSGYRDEGKYTNTDQLSVDLGYLDQKYHFVRMTPLATSGKKR